MGRDNHNAGLHIRSKNYKTPSDVIDEKDKYAEIIANSSKKKYGRKPYSGINDLKIDKDFFYKKPIVEVGDIIFVTIIATNEQRELHILDVNNPFVKKKQDEMVIINGEKYRITEICKSKC